MTDQVAELVKGYWDWLRRETLVRPVTAQWTEITTPHLDRHNDYLQIFARRLGAQYELSDDGYILDDLRMSGCEVEGKKAQDILSRTLMGYGVQRGPGDELIVRASEQNFPQRFHSLLQAMLAVDDMFYLASPTVISIFFELVDAWLKLNDVRSIRRTKYPGKSSYLHQFDFSIPSSRVQPLRIVDAISSPSKEKAVNLAFKWHDIRESLEEGARAYAILNDENTIKSSVIQALEAYEIRPIRWSEREAFIQELAA